MDAEGRTLIRAGDAIRQVQQALEPDGVAFRPRTFYGKIAKEMELEGAIYRIGGAVMLDGKAWERWEPYVLAHVRNCSNGTWQVSLPWRREDVDRYHSGELDRSQQERKQK